MNPYKTICPFTPAQQADIKALATSYAWYREAERVHHQGNLKTWSACLRDAQKATGITLVENIRSTM
jgi:hypothetical protein